MENKFWLFAWNNHYPDGGAFDFQGSYRSAPEAKSCKPRHKDCAQVVNVVTEEIVASFFAGKWEDNARKL